MTKTIFYLHFMAKIYKNKILIFRKKNFKKKWTCVLIVLLTKLDHGQVVTIGGVSMSTRELYHNHGAKALKYQSSEIIDGATYYHATVLPNYIVCPKCGAIDIIKRGFSKRVIQSVPIGLRPTFLAIKVNRIYCPQCDSFGRVDIKCADQFKSYTKKLNNCVIYDAKNMSISKLSKRYHLHWNTCEEIIINDLKKRYKNINISNLKYIAIDETSYKHGHKYITVVVNLETGRIIYVGLGKGGSALDGFFQILGPRRCAKIKAVSIDMSPAYIYAVTKNLKNAKIVFDHFHIVKLFNQHLSAIRSQAAKSATEDGKKFLFGSRWLLLKNPENLDPDKNEPERLKAALDLNKTLFTAYYMKADLRQIWDQPSVKKAQNKILDWINLSYQTNDSQLIKMGQSLEKYTYGILNWYDFPVNSGQIEAINGKIKLLLRMSYGLRNFENLKLRLYAIHEIAREYNGI
jgi:transposase